MTSTFGTIAKSDNYGMNNQVHINSTFHYRMNSSFDEVLPAIQALQNRECEVTLLPPANIEIEGAKARVAEALRLHGKPAAIKVTCDIPASLKRSMIHQKTADRIQLAIGMGMTSNSFSISKFNNESLLSRHFNRLYQLSTSVKKCPECHSRINIKELSTPYCPDCQTFGLFFSKGEHNRYMQLSDDWHYAQTKSNMFMRQYTYEVLHGQSIDPTTCTLWVVGTKSTSESQHD